MRIFQAVLPLALTVGCGVSSGHAWVSELPEEKAGRPLDDGWRGGAPRASKPGAASSAGPLPGGADDAIEVRDFGDGTARAVIASGTSDADRGSSFAAAAEALFRNTYYDFPREGVGAKAATIFDASCAEIAKVTQDFHDRVCVQGSGRLETGATVSFAKRDCSCAAECPRTAQKICFERLDPARFPHGRGATGRSITPMRTVAVDTAVIPLGTSIFVPEFVGVPRPDGSRHDGCFIAEDRGLKVVGRQIDVFTGDPALTSRWNSLLPSNRGVHVIQNDPRCRPGG
jgi:3D (Asp-Asp-Asp) domain-containing protein